jgi:hypothetical protein
VSDSLAVNDEVGGDGLGSRVGNVKDSISTDDNRSYESWVVLEEVYLPAPPKVPVENTKPFP